MNISRRDFLAATGAATLASNFNSTFGGDPSDFKVGYNTLTWGDNVEQAINEISELGFAGIQIRADDYRKYSGRAAEFKELMKLRSGCERSNSVKKVAHKLERRPCRSATHYLVRLYLISIVEHAKAWLAEDRKVLGNDWKVLSDPEKIKQAANKPPA